MTIWAFLIFDLNNLERLSRKKVFSWNNSVSPITIKNSVVVFCEILKTWELHSQSYLGHNGVLLGVTQEDRYLDLARVHSGPPVCNLMKNFRGVPNCKKCGKRNRGSSTSSPASIVNDHLLLWLLLRKLDLDLKQGITIHSG